MEWFLLYREPTPRSPARHQPRHVIGLSAAEDRAFTLARLHWARASTRCRQSRSAAGLRSAVDRPSALRSPERRARARSVGPVQGQRDHGRPDAVGGADGRLCRRAGDLERHGALHDERHVVPAPAASSRHQPARWRLHVGDPSGGRLSRGGAVRRSRIAHAGRAVGGPRPSVRQRCGCYADGAHRRRAASIASSCRSCSPARRQACPASRRRRRGLADRLHDHADAPGVLTSGVEQGGGLAFSGTRENPAGRGTAFRGVCRHLRRLAESAAAGRRQPTALPAEQPAAQSHQSLDGRRHESDCSHAPPKALSGRGAASHRAGDLLHEHPGRLDRRRAACAGGDAEPARRRRDGQRMGAGGGGPRRPRCRRGVSADRRRPAGRSNPAPSLKRGGPLRLDAVEAPGGMACGRNGLAGGAPVHRRRRPDAGARAARSRRHPPATGRSRLRHLHVRLDRRSQGRDDRSPRGREHHRGRQPAIRRHVSRSGARALVARLRSLRVRHLRSVDGRRHGCDPRPRRRDGSAALGRCLSCAWRDDLEQRARVDAARRGGRRAAGEQWPDSLRLVLLSGDWIPVGLPDRIRAVADTAQVVGWAARPRRRSGRSSFRLDRSTPAGRASRRRADGESARTSSIRRSIIGRCGSLASCTSPAQASRAATGATRGARPRSSSRIPARASGCTGPAISAGICPTATSSSSGGRIFRSRFTATGSSSAKSKRRSNSTPVWSRPPLSRSVRRSSAPAWLDMSP